MGSYNQHLNLICFRIPFQMMIYLFNHQKESNQNYVLNISRELSTTNSVCLRYLKLFEEIGLITRGKKQNRRRIITLTPFGRKIAKKFQEISDILPNWELEHGKKK